MSLRLLGRVAFPTIPYGLSHELGENGEGEKAGHRWGGAVDNVSRVKRDWSAVFA